MNPRRKNRLKLVSFLLVGIIATSSLILYALSANIDLFYTPSEIIHGKGEKKEMPHVGQRLRIGGMVMPGSVHHDSKNLNVEFKLYDANAELTVTYQGILPDLFREGQSIVAQGELQEGNVIKASEVLAKHDENYTPPEVKNAMEKNHNLPAEAYQ